MTMATVESDAKVKWGDLLENKLQMGNCIWTARISSDKLWKSLLSLSKGCLSLSNQEPITYKAKQEFGFSIFKTQIWNWNLETWNI